MYNYKNAILRSEMAMVHSGKVQAVQFGPRPKICVATFFTEFRVDVLSCYLTDNRKIKPGMLQFARAEHDAKKKNQFWLFAMDSRIGTVLLFATAKTTYTKILQKRRKVLWMEHFDRAKNNPTYSIIIAKHAHGKGWNFFLFFYKGEIRHYF